MTRRTVSSSRTARMSVSPLRFDIPDTITSVVKCQGNGPLIAAASDLWISPNDEVLDVTYGRGKFWTHTRPKNLIAHDKFVGDGVDFRALPEAAESADVVVFDPPYIAQGGRETSTVPDMLDRYGLHGAPKSVAELDVLIADGITEAARVLRPSGRLMVKCMDYVNGGRFVTGRHKVVTTAHFCDLEQVDEFIHYSGTGPQPTDRAGEPIVQMHSRRAHTFLCVFQKPPVWRKRGDRG